MRRRLLGLDLIRLASLIAIWYFHTQSVGWYEVTGQMSDHWIWRAAEIYSRVIPFSGFTILILTCFLHGMTWKGWRKATPLLGFLLAGWVVLNLLVMSEHRHFWIWDIYPLIALGLLTAPLAPRTLGVVGLIMTWIPFWQWGILQEISPYWRHMVIGNCANDMADWPILPWIGLTWAAFAAGREIRGLMFRVGRLEGFALTVLLAASTLRWGVYYNVPLNGGFGCHMFRQAPLTWWCHLIWPMALIRLSVDPRIQGHLERFKPARWVGSLAISRHFWFAYLTHYLLINAIFLDRGEVLEQYPVLCTAAYLSILPVTEILTRLLLDRRLATPFLAGLEQGHDRS